MIVLPECFNSPYGCQYFPKYAETILPSPPSEEKSPSWHMLSKVAAETKTYLIGGSIPEFVPESKQYFNTSLVFSPSGELLATHRKTHLFDIDIPGKITFRESDVLSPGNKVTIFDIPEYGKIGLAICYDVRFPELAMIGCEEGRIHVCLSRGFQHHDGSDALDFAGTCESNGQSDIRRNVQSSKG